MRLQYRRSIKALYRPLRHGGYDVHDICTVHRYEKNKMSSVFGEISVHISLISLKCLLVLRKSICFQISLYIIFLMNSRTEGGAIRIKFVNCPNENNPVHFSYLHSTNPASFSKIGYEVVLVERLSNPRRGNEIRRTNPCQRDGVCPNTGAENSTRNKEKVRRRLFVGSLVRL